MISAGVLVIGIFVGGVVLTAIFATTVILLQTGTIRPGFMREAKEEIPGFPGVRQKSVNGIYPVSETSIALKVFKQCWEDAFGPVKDFDKKIYKNLDIIYNDDLIEVKVNKEYSTGGETHQKAAGITDSITKVRIWIKDEDYQDGKKVPRQHRLSETALFHELVHVALWRLNGSPDYDHEGEVTKGWTPDHTHKVVIRAKTLLSEQGL